MTIPNDLPPHIPAPGERPPKTEVDRLNKSIADRARRYIEMEWLERSSSVKNSADDRITFSLSRVVTPTPDGPNTRHTAKVSVVLSGVQLNDEGVPIQRELSWGIQVEDPVTHSLGQEPDYQPQIQDRWVPTQGNGIVNFNLLGSWEEAGMFEPPADYPTAEQFFILQGATEFSNIQGNRPPPPID
jgi:hypothetical protein